MNTKRVASHITSRSALSITTESSAMPQVVHVKSVSEWDTHMLETSKWGGKGAVVDFTANWCGPCKMIGPIFDRLSDEYPNVKFLKVDVDELQEIAKSAGIRAMPTFKAYFNGSQVDELVGADQARLRTMIEGVANRATPTGTGRKLGGDDVAASGATSATAPDSAGDRRRKMAEAAEARMKASVGN